MFDHNAYRERCSELHVSEEALQEVIEMAEQKQKKPVRRPLRVGLIAAVVTVALMVTVSAANPEALEWLSATIRSSASIGDYREEIVMDDTGETITALRLPDTAVEERDGRIILTVDGEETDITEGHRDQRSGIRRKGPGRQPPPGSCFIVPPGRSVPRPAGPCPRRSRPATEPESWPRPAQCG